MFIHYLLALLAAHLISVSVADRLVLENLYHKLQDKSELLLLPDFGSAYQELFFAQRLDHFSPTDQRTFQQRYYVRLNNLTCHAPIFLYVGGESELRASSVFSGTAANIATNYGAIMVGLEHRFYGKSHPFTQLSTENLRYLTSQQALHDLAEFIRFLQTTTLSSSQCSDADVEDFESGMQSHAPDQHRFRINDISTTIKTQHHQQQLQSKLLRKVVIIGGSYPGNLAAWFREKFPHLVVGAWASSGPVRAKSDYFEYDQVVSEQLGDICSQMVRSATDTIERLLEIGNMTAIEEVKNRFHSQMAHQVHENVAFLYILADIVAYVVQYDNPGMSLRQKLCDYDSRKKSPLEQFAQFSRYFFDRMQTEPREMDMTALNSTEITGYGQNMRQWMWQSCAEFGYWQTAPKHRPLRSRLIDERWHLDTICVNIFGFPPGYRVPIEATNQRYGSTDIVNAVDRIFFTNGDIDPWKVLSVPTELGRHEYSPVKMIEGVGHCADLRRATDKDPMDLIQTRQVIKERIGKWLNNAI